MLLGILNFALKCLYVLSWPFFSLGYPLCASIQAIENNSNSDTQTLVTYWIVFSLISLFENAFLKFLERLLFWQHMKLMIICWLVVPHFDGAIYVYNHFIHPCLSMNPPIFVDEFNKWKEFLFKRDNFLAQAERYINKNGPEALEELIAAKSENRTSATKEIKETARELPDIPMPKEVRKKWTCDICQLTVLCEKNLNLHLQGRKHKATYEALKTKNQPNIVRASTAKKTARPVEEPQKTVYRKEWKQKTITNNEGEQNGQSMGVSASTAKKCDQPTREENEKRVSMSNSGLEPKNEADSEENYTFRCNICNTKCNGENDLAAHYNGRKHKARIQLHNIFVGIGQV
ncbi:hypothetical protein ACB092_07G105500 [Castanea dentata]